MNMQKELRDRELALKTSRNQTLAIKECEILIPSPIFVVHFNKKVFE